MHKSQSSLSPGKAIVDQHKQEYIRQHLQQERIQKERVLQLRSMQKGINKGLFMALPKCETSDFLTHDDIKEKDLPDPVAQYNPASTFAQRSASMNQKVNYAKQKSLLKGIDQKLNYFNLQRERHPYIKELRDFADAQKEKTKTGTDFQTKHESAINVIAKNSMNASMVPKDEEMQMQEIIRLRYRTTQKDDSSHAFTAMNSRKNSCAIPDDIQKAYQTTDNRQAQSQASMLRSERFRTTVRDEPFALDFGVKSKFAGIMSKQQLENAENARIVKEREGVTKTQQKAQKLLKAARSTSFVPFNKRRNYNAIPEMGRWVGSTINDSIVNPELDDKIQVKLSKKFLNHASPAKNYQVPSTTHDFFNPKDKLDYRMKTELKERDDRFIWVDKTRKVGRQRIPEQYLKRDAMLRTVLEKFNDVDQMKDTRQTEFDKTVPCNGAQSAMELPKNTTSTMSMYVTRDSLPLSSQLKKLAALSTQQCYQQNIPIYHDHRKGVSYDDTRFRQLHIGVQAQQVQSMGGKRRVNGFMENSRTGVPSDF